MPLPGIFANVADVGMIRQQSASFLTRQIPELCNEPQSRDPFSLGTAHVGGYAWWVAGRRSSTSARSWRVLTREPSVPLFRHAQTAYSLLDRTEVMHAA
jgi:hypothetical protein